ncbi:hypothetical protein [Planctobacterium marinum]|uniref:Uncharacterized protein n=1 Tax=Planctobacterium marinum TaxID=1631968 RepID=A0AA48HL33_9ALTE|nr:hypothetical protein MACH26_39270 [Planctobacterium marinum]
MQTKLSFLVLCVAFCFTWFFGEPLYFDRILFAILIATTVLSFKWDKNLFAISLVVLCELALEEIFWLFSRDNNWLLLPAYAYCLLAIYINRRELSGKLAFMVFALSLCAEIYWLLADKQGPRIFFYIFICGNLLLLKHYAFMRPHICNRNFKQYHHWKWIKTDGQVEDYAMLHLGLNLAMISEYLLRHIAGMNNALYVYHGYSYLSHVINGFLFLIIAIALTNTIKSKLFTA